MKNQVTIYHIAEELGVTVSTVSRALNNAKSISEQTKKLVWEKAKELNYRPNKLAASLKSGKTGIVGVIVPSAQIHFFAKVIHHIELNLKEAGYKIIVYQTNESYESEKEGIKTLLELQVDGIMASPSLETVDTAHFSEVKKQGKVLVIFDRGFINFKSHSVIIDDFNAGYLATQHLLGNGFRKITYIASKHQLNIFKKRIEGYLKALKEFGNLSGKVIYTGLSIEDGQKKAEEILSSPDIPDAIIAADDFVALGLLQKFKELGLENKFAVMGFANEVFSGFISPPLTTVEQKPDKMGAICARIFLENIESPEKEMQNVIIEPEVIARESTKKAGFENPA